MNGERKEEEEDEEEEEEEKNVIRIRQRRQAYRDSTKEIVWVSGNNRQHCNIAYVCGHVMNTLHIESLVFHTLSEPTHIYDVFCR